MDWLRQKVRQAAKIGTVPVSWQEMMKLYQYEGCGYCHDVRQKMSELLLTYVVVNVPVEQRLRTEVMAVSGQATVPVLVDGDVVLDDEDEILEYLENTYGKKRI